jgi:hypothetical protein
MKMAKRTDEEIALIRAQRAEKKAKKASLEEVNKYFPNEEATKNSLSYLQREIRQFRKKAVDAGITKVVLPDELKHPFYLAFERLGYDTYRPELGDLLIEGLKLQDREVKVFSYRYLDTLFTEKGVDFGWLSRMLAKRYVSRYGWQLMRKHATPGSLLVSFGGEILKEALEMWAKDAKTQKDWARLSREDGKPADMREILPRR